jgi:hypothetical protein
MHLLRRHNGSNWPRIISWLRLLAVTNATELRMQADVAQNAFGKNATTA